MHSAIAGLVLLSTVQRIHITGASGSGTTTLGAALAVRLDYPHFDADSYFWLPVEPKFRNKRQVGERNEMLQTDLREHDDWVLSGSITGWGTDAGQLFSLAVYLWVPTSLRIQRLKQREAETFGPAIEPGGERRAEYEDFIAWAKRYDYAGIEQRSRAVHEAWLIGMTCPVLRLEGEMPTGECVDRICSELGL